MRKTLLLSGAALAAAALSACATSTIPPDPAAPGRMAATAAVAAPQVTPMQRDRALAGAQPLAGISDQEYLILAGASDLFEIESSRLALERTESPSTRRYAEMLIQHHTTSTQALMQQAKLAGMTPPTPVLTVDQQAAMSRLQAAGSGPAFDRAYYTEQVPAHRRAWQVHQGYAQNGRSPQLRVAAAAAVPIVEQHLVQAAAQINAL